jgi:leader peptidase (prepilin peptidase)/N-methyltransferase
VTPEWIWLIFLFALGSCVGSFLNVVIYRLPLDKSLVTPPSACPKCQRRIRFYDNIPLFSWVLLGGKCRYCKERISVRYFVIELLTALIFVGVFVLYFITPVRKCMVDGLFGPEQLRFDEGGWVYYSAHVALLSAFLAASAIDLELWVIPLSICWFVTAVGVVASGLGGFVLSPAVIRTYRIFPQASASVGALAAGGAIGLLIALGALVTGLIKRSYESEESEETQDSPQAQGQEVKYNDRAEVLKEVVFLLPIVFCAVGAYLLYRHVEVVGNWWGDFSQLPVVAGVAGSLCGYFVGCAVVWTTRILGTLGFGKEAMGLGDVHLMGAAGAVIGPVSVVIAFFLAPFFGLAWAGYQMFFRKTRQIPYGPFLSLAVFAVMICHDRVWDRLSNIFVFN